MEGIYVCIYILVCVCVLYTYIYIFIEETVVKWQRDAGSDRSRWEFLPQVETSACD